MNDDVAEVMETLQRLRYEFEDIAVGGTRAVGLDRVTALRAMQAECERIGATHIAQRLTQLATAIEDGDRSAAEHLMKAQASVRVFERMLTLESASTALDWLAREVDEEEDDLP